MVSYESSQAVQLRDHASKVLYGLSISNFNAVFSRISLKLKSLSNEVSSSNDSANADMTDIELIQHIHMDLSALQKLLHGKLAIDNLQ